MQWYYSLMRSINHFGPKEWMVILITLTAIGVFCMKGFGTRKDF